MDHRENLGFVIGALGFGRQNFQTMVLDIEQSQNCGPLIVFALNPVVSLHVNSIHDLGNQLLPVLSQTINACPHKKMCPGRPSCAEKLEDVAFTIPNMNAPAGVVEKIGGLLEILKPAQALLFRNRYPCGALYSRFAYEGR